MCVLIRLSETLNPRQARGFLVTYILIGCISILELISVLVNDGPVWLRWLNILSNYLGFGLTPAVPICLVYTLNCVGRHDRERLRQQWPWKSCICFCLTVLSVFRMVWCFL